MRVLAGGGIQSVHQSASPHGATIHSRLPTNIRVAIRYWHLSAWSRIWHLQVVTPGANREVVVQDAAITDAAVARPCIDLERLGADAKTFFRIVGALWLAAIGFIVYEKRDELPWGLGAAGTTEQAWRDIGDFTFAVLADFGTVGIAITIVAMLLTRAVNKTGELLMSLYQVVVNRFVIPVIEAHKAEGREQGRTEGREQGRTEGRDQGRAEARAEWQAWNERRLAAERAGREFAEPPPED